MFVFVLGQDKGATAHLLPLSCKGLFWDDGWGVGKSGNYRGKPGITIRESRMNETGVVR
jgi:hypothetical protein